MFRTRTRKVLRDVWARKIRTLLVSSSIFIGVFGVVTLFSTGEILIRQLRSDLQENRLAMVRTQVTVNSGATVDNVTYLDALRQNPAITEVEGRAVYPLFWKLPGADTFEQGTIVAHIPALDRTTLEPTRLIDGRYPTPGANEIAIEQRMADEYGLAAGDTLDLRILSRSGNPSPAATPASTGTSAAGRTAQLTIRQETWTISGIVFQPYGEIGATGPVPPETSVFAAYGDAQHIAGFTGLSAIYTRYVDYATAEAESANLKSAIANNTPYVPTFTILEDPANNGAIESAQTTSRLLVTLALVALVVSGFLVVNVVNSIVVEQRRQIGVLKSLGATRLDNFGMYSGIALAYGLIGVIPGVLLGIPGGYFAAKGLAAQSGTIITGFAISPTGIILGIVVGLAVPFLAAVLPVLNGTRVSILEAMTNLGIDANYGKGPIARLIARIPMPITLRQAVNNVNQKKFRLALTGTTLTIAVGAFMGIFAVFSSLTGLVQDVFGTIGNQISISPTEGQNFDQVRMLIENNVSGIRTIDPGASLAIDIQGYNPPPVSAGPPGLFALGINTANPAIAPLELRSGTGWNDDPTRDGVILSARIADSMGKTVGDAVTILAGGNRSQYTIIGVANYPFDTVWMKWDALARLGGLVKNAPTPDDYAMGTTTVRVAGYDGSLNGQTGALGLASDVGRFLSFTSGSFVQPGEQQVIVSEGMAERGGYTIGDTLDLALNGNHADYTITGIFELPAQLAARPDHPRDVVGLYWQDLARLEGRSFEGDPYPNSIDIILSNPDPSSAQVDETISQINEVLLEAGITADYTNWVDFSETITGFIVAFGVILNLAAALIAIVGAIGLLTSLSMSVFERQKEIGVMRSVGATSGTIAVQFLIEGLTIGVAAWAFGVPISYLLSKGLISVLNFGEVFNIGYPPITPVIGLGGMLVVVTIASLWPSLSAARKTVSDILRYQ